MTDLNDELKDWMRDWQDQDAQPPPGDTLQRYVRRRGRLLKEWIVTETIVAVLGLSALIYLALIRVDIVDRVVMGTLAVACAAMLLFGWWNWRGSLNAIGETTAVYLQLSAMRLVRVQRALIAGWVLLAVEMVAFIPWVRHRQQATLTADSSAIEILWPWALLATMGGLALSWLIRLRRWIRREMTILDQLRREYDD